MTDSTSYRFEKADRTLMQRLFEPPSIGRMSPVAKFVAYAILFVWTLFVLFPIYWVLITSFKLPPDVNHGPHYLPFIDFQPSLHAWKQLLFTDYAHLTLNAFKNSIIISLAATVLCMVIGSMAAYALARIEYRPKFGSIMIFVLLGIGMFIVSSTTNIPWYLAAVIAFALFLLLVKALSRHFKATLRNGDILFWIISQRILPPIVVIIPIYIMFQSVGLIDTKIALILAYAVVNLPIVVWLMQDFFASLPIELEESAQLDGASRLGIFFDIVLPLTRPGLAATTMLVLILCWNEYLLAVFLSTSKAQTMPIMVAAMNAGDKGILWWTMCAAIVLMIIPVIAMAIVLQRYISRGVLQGAVKG